MKLGRNKPCPCGSGKKYKKCCLSLSGKVPNIFIDDQQQKNKYGDVRPIISIDFQDKKFVAVGDELHYASSDKWKTFPDFLFDYLKTKLGSKWGNEELSKLETERHPLIQWYAGVVKFQNQQVKDTDGIYRVHPDSPTFAFLSVAYDVYTLKHHSYLQNTILDRLKNKDQFRGARYELFATATCIRAGFDIAFENERDGTKKHPEFIATHKNTKQQISVEAKTKKKSKTLNGTCKIINGALEKENGHPFVVFMDLNLPDQIAEKEFNAPVPNKITNIVDGITSSKNGNDRFNMIIFTNQPHNFYTEDHFAPTRTLCVISDKAERVTLNTDIFWSLRSAALQTNIPNEFPEDNLK